MPKALSQRAAAPATAVLSAVLVRQFPADLVAWQRTHGRSSLPWQNTRDPYRVWLSEIMLQQTQVSTVLDYYARFLERFPTVQSLAEAQPDVVLGLWSGLGYYSRARNLHRCAQDVMSLHGGAFPSTSEVLQTLPGIGPSTAAAIASFCFDERAAILDGNVKRVLTRLLAFDADLSQGKAERRLWDLARELLPAAADMPAYTQGLMDLGATLCTSRKPRCMMCPVQRLCEAKKGGEPEKFPVKTRKLKRSAQALWLLRAERRSDGAIWLERRPSSGIWGGLHCLPVFDDEAALMQALPAQARTSAAHGARFTHVLTHKDLHLKPVAAHFGEGEQPGLLSATAFEPSSAGWFLPADWSVLGLPAPVRKLLETS
jgi:A/G-specific adenine glycosylase